MFRPDIYENVCNDKIPGMLDFRETGGPDDPMDHRLPFYVFRVSSRKDIYWPKVELRLNMSSMSCWVQVIGKFGFSEEILRFSSYFPTDNDYPIDLFSSFICLWWLEILCVFGWPGCSAGHHKSFSNVVGHLIEFIEQLVRYRVNQIDKVSYYELHIVGKQYFVPILFTVSVMV